jgi:hypothetical protein
LGPALSTDHGEGWGRSRPGNSEWEARLKASTWLRRFPRKLIEAQKAKKRHKCHAGLLPRLTDAFMAESKIWRKQFQNFKISRAEKCIRDLHLNLYRRRYPKDSVLLRFSHSSFLHILSIVFDRQRDRFMISQFALWKL